MPRQISAMVKSINIDRGYTKPYTWSGRLRLDYDSGVELTIKLDPDEVVAVFELIRHKLLVPETVTTMAIANTLDEIHKAKETPDED